MELSLKLLRGFLTENLLLLLLEETSPYRVFLPYGTKKFTFKKLFHHLVLSYEIFVLSSLQRNPVKTPLKEPPLKITVTM